MYICLPMHNNDTKLRHEATLAMQGRQGGSDSQVGCSQSLNCYSNHLLISFTLFIATIHWTRVVSAWSSGLPKTDGKPPLKEVVSSTTMHTCRSSTAIYLWCEACMQEQRKHCMTYLIYSEDHTLIGHPSYWARLQSGKCMTWGCRLEMTAIMFILQSVKTPKFIDG